MSEVYVRGANPQTKKEFREMVKHAPVPLTVPGGFYGPKDVVFNGETTVYGPHFPQPHKWYARVRVDEEFRAVKVIL